MQGEHARPTSSRLCGANTTPVLVLVTRSMNAMMKSRAAMYPGMAHSSR
jgi:hypothetical protein